MATEVQETKKVELKEVSKETSRTGGRTTTFDRNKSRNNQRNNNKNQRRQNADDIEKRIVSIRRVSHTYKGGKRMSLSVLVVVGDRKGKVGAAVGKGADVKSAETKAYNKAKKNMVTVQLHNTTIPHQILHKKGAVKIFMKPAAPGTGVIAGASLRSVLELVGVKDILTKIIGASNPITNVYATIEALQSMKS
jgi:small subunit ribosomal protein S5